MKLLNENTSMTNSNVMDFLEVLPFGKVFPRKLEWIHRTKDASCLFAKCSLCQVQQCRAIGFTYKLILITVVFASLFAAALTRLNCLKGLNNTARTRQQWIAIWDWVEMSERAVNSQKSSFSSVLVKQSTRYFALRKLVISAKKAVLRNRGIRKYQQHTWSRR